VRLLYFETAQGSDRAASVTHTRAGAELAEVTPVLIWA